MHSPIRIALAALAMTAASASFGGAKADQYRWCADMGGDRGGTNCYYVTLEQCRWAISGLNSATCVPSPFYTDRGKAPAPRARPRS